MTEPGLSADSHFLLKTSSPGGVVKLANHFKYVSQAIDFIQVQITGQIKAKSLTLLSFSLLWALRLWREVG